MKKALSLYASSKYVKSSVFNELYVGGGRPSVLAEGQITDILEYCRDSFNISSDSSTKFAACTNNLSEEKIQLLASTKVDQLDIGIQTFDEEFRRMLLLRDSSKNAKLKL